VGPRDEARRVALGRVVGAHGVGGALRVRVLGDGPEHLLSLAELDLSTREEEPERDPSPRHARVRDASPGRAGEVRLSIEGVDDRDAALALRGAFVLAPASVLPALPEGEHYWYELVGCAVEDAEGRVLGTVRELWDTPGHDLLVVEDEAGREHLVPATDPFLRDVDVAARRIRIETIPGLIEP
jgi:16S rRNA processing protein RimM